MERRWGFGKKQKKIEMSPKKRERDQKMETMEDSG
jgi:hypothetical protein